MYNIKLGFDSTKEESTIILDYLKSDNEKTVASIYEDEQKTVQNVHSFLTKRLKRKILDEQNIGDNKVVLYGLDDNDSIVFVISKGIPVSFHLKSDNLPDTLKATIENNIE